MSTSGARRPRKLHRERIEVTIVDFEGRGSPAPPPLPLPGGSVRYHVTMGDRTLEVELGPDGVTVDGEPVEADLRHVAGTRVYGLLLDGASHRLVAKREEDGAWSVRVGGRRLRAEVVDERTRAIREMTGSSAGASGPRPLRAPMPGLVVKVEVEEGDDVAPGTGLVVVEAMKMENELCAEAAGRVRRVRVTAGDTVEKDQVLLEFEVSA